ncbi:MAG: glycosyltransferase family 2 protein [Methyloligellaceae bacterium]
MKTTIIVSPRERFSSVVQSLKSLFKTIPEDVRVIVIEGGSPKSVRKQLADLQKIRKFEHIPISYWITPNEARNIGAKMATTEFVAFCDNDIDYQAGWLDSLEKNAADNNSDIVAPLIFIGPNENGTPIIHHAGGDLSYKQSDDGIIIKETHRLMNRRLGDVEANLEQSAPIDNEVAEFHCLLMRKSFYDRMGGLDERLITREQMDLALRSLALGAKVTFEKDSHVTYLAKVPFIKMDIPYHLFRWSDELALKSIAAFENSWDVKLDSKRIRHSWIRNHRRRGVVSMFPISAKLFGRKLLGKILTPLFDVWISQHSRKTRISLELFAPNKVADAGFVQNLASAKGNPGHD